MRLKKLLKNLPIQEVKGSKEIEISGVCANSKLIVPGNLFVAKKGNVGNGSDFISEAIAAGAVAVLTDIYNPSLKNVTQLVHPDVSLIEALCAAEYYQNANQELFMVGITGTNGKTTTSFLIKHLLDNLYGPCGLIGTIEYIIGQHRYQATRTTPDVTSNHKMLREMVLQGCRSAVMEVTSHALTQGRVSNIDFDVAIFTNLSLDHLDYHQTMENYCAAKNKLFRSLAVEKLKNNFTKTAIVNADSAWYLQMLEGAKARVITYSINNPADLRAINIEMSASHTKFTLVYQGKSVPCLWPLIGRFNIYNCLAASAMALSRGVDLELLPKLLQTFSPVPGRLEKVSNEIGLKIYVDFAHSDDALANVLESLQEVKTGRIITVFGCGGDRDISKRPKMGKVAGQLSDISIVTSDNPRSEEPEEIIKQVIEGFSPNDYYIVEVDRSKAIQHAIDIATPEDIILIAGKGHEPYQIFAHKTIEFDDRKIARVHCKNRELRESLFQIAT
jgi:UDP-N-acetylmuramoyl-L-alanyl-D-glutamate--2,6-diaminopimelate ligase